MTKTTDVYGLVLLAVILTGMGSALYFVVTFRPRRRLALVSVDAGGFVVVILLLYLWALIRLLTGNTTRPDGPVAAVVSLALGWMISALLLVRAVVWRRIRHSTRAAAYRGPDRRQPVGEDDVRSARSS